MNRAGYIVILFRNVYAYTYICMHAMIINKEQVMDLKERRRSLWGSGKEKK